MNRKGLLGEHANKGLGNIVGVGVVLITAVLGLRLVLKATGIL